MNNRCIFFTATHRSGSTLLMELIRKMDIIGRPGELFYPQNIAEILRREGSKPAMEINNWLPQVIEEGSSPTGWFAAKIFADNFQWLAKQCSTSSWPDSTKDLQGFFKQHFSGAVFFSIRRRDSVKQGISLHKALQTGIWHSNQVGKVKSRKAYYQRDLIQWAINNIKRQEEDLETVYSELGVTPVTFYYEDIIKDIPGTLATIFKTIGEPLPTIPLPEIKLRKLSNPENKAWQERFNQEQEIAQSGGQALLKTGESPVFTLNLISSKEPVLPGTKLELSFSLENNSGQAIGFIGHRGGSGSIHLTLQTHEASSGKLISEPRLPTPHCMEPNETQTLDFHYETPSRPGDYQLSVKAEQLGLGSLNLSGCTQIPINVSAHLEEPIKRIFGSFEYTADNWYYCPWFGYFYANAFPWILSLHHGWIKVEEEASASGSGKDGEVAFYDFKMGGWKTSPALYPQITKADGTVLKHLRTEGERRIFLDADGAVREIPLSKNED